MVGTARFELATSRTPSVRATRLRYVPTGCAAGGGRAKLRLSLAFEERQETAQGVAELDEDGAVELYGAVVLRGDLRR